MVSIFNANIIFKLSLKLRKYMYTEKIDNNGVEEFSVLLHNYPRDIFFNACNVRFEQIMLTWAMPALNVTFISNPLHLPKKIYNKNYQHLC